MKLFTRLKTRLPKLRLPLKQLSFKIKKRQALQSFAIGILFIAALMGGTAYFELPPGIQVSEFIQSQSENKADLLDVVAIADFSGPTRMIGQDLAQGFKDAADAGNIS
jgi:hypothetical protein